MLKIFTGSLKEGIKELGKFKAKESKINLISNDNSILLVKVYERADSQIEIVAYEVDGVAEGFNNYELSDNIIKAMSKINETNITIEDADDNNVKIYSEKRELNFVTDGHKFSSELLKFEDREKFLVNGEEIKTILQTIDFVAKDETRPILQGVNFKNNKVASLDGYRLAIRECSSMNLEGEYTVHVGALKVIKSLVKKDSKMQIAFNENTCKIELGKLIVYSRLMQSNYIKYESLIPTEYNVNATFDTKEFIEELDFLLSMSEETLFKMDVTKEKISIQGIQAKSNATIQLNDAEADGDITIAFNINYIKEALKHFNDKVIFKFIKSNSPIVCEYKDLKGLDLILPVRLIR